MSPRRAQFVLVQSRPAWLAMFGVEDAKWLQANVDPRTLRLWFSSSRGVHNVYELELDDPESIVCSRVTSSGSEPFELDAAAVEGAREEIDAFHQRMLWVQKIVNGDSLPSRYKPTSEDLELAECHRLLRELRRSEERNAGGLPTIDVGDQEDELGVRLYLRLIAGAWDEVMRLADAAGDDVPAWIAPVVYACAGDVDRLQEIASLPQSELEQWGGLNAFAGLALKELQFDAQAFETLRTGLMFTKLSERAHYYVPMAELARDLHGDDMAIRCLRWASAARPDDDHLMIRIVRDLLRYGAFAEGAEILEARAAKGPPHFEVILTLAELSLWCGRTDDARGWIEKARALEPDNVGVLRADAACRVLEGRHDEALKIFEGIEALDDPETMAWMSEIYMGKGDRDRATHYLNYARARAQTPLHALLTALVDRDIYPNVVAIVQNEAEADGRTVETPQLEDAAELLKSLHGNRREVLTRVPGGKPAPASGLQLMRPAPQDDDLVSRDLSADLLKTIRTQPIADVHEGFKELNRRFPESPHPWCYWGELRLWLGEFDEAQACFTGNEKTMIARWGFVGRAAIYVHNGEFDKALDEFRRLAYVFEPVPGATTHVYLGELYRLRGEYDDAIREFEVALSAKPGRVAAHMSLALCHLELGRDDEAIAIYQQLSAKHPRLFWDICRSLKLPWPAEPEHAAVVLEEGLRLMRGNRSSHTITYFDCDDRFRIVEDVEAWRRMAANRVPLVEREITNRLTA